nr:MAG TPA: tail tape measure [Caudoviricetes sp.]
MSGKGTTLKGITVEIGGDTTKLGDAILKARKSAKDLSGELRGVESLLKLDPTNTVLLAQKQDILAESIAGAKDKLKMLIAAQESMSKQLADGKISPEQYRDFEREIESTRQQLTRLEAAASGTDDAVADVGDAARDAGEKAEKASGGWSVLKGALADLAASAIKTAASAISDTAQEMITGAAEYGDTIDKMSQKMGMSSDAYQEWDFVLQHCGASIESLKPAMKTLATAAESGSDAFAQLGISQEQIAGMSQEQLFDATIAGLQNVTDETQRTYLAGKLLGRGATELGPLLNTSADDVADMRAQVHDLGGVMGSDAVKAAAAYQDSLQNMQYAFSGLKNNISGELLPTLTLIMDGVTKMLTGGGDEVAAAVGDLVVSLSGQLTAQAPRMMSVALTFIAALVTGLLSALPDLTGTSVELVGALLLGIAEQLPGIIVAAATAVQGIVDKITSPESITLLVQAAVQILLALANGLVGALPELIDTIPIIITNLVDAVLASLPEIVEAGLQIIIALASGIVTNSGHVLAVVPKLIVALVHAFGSYVSSVAGIGKAIVDGIRKGITEQWQRLKADVSNLFTGLVDWIKKLLGIHSPSTVFAGIGTNMAKGIGAGWQDTIGDINRDIAATLQPQYVVGVDMQGLYAQAATLQTAAAPAAAGGDIAAVLERMDRLERAITGMQIYMDGDALVGSVATRMDYALGGIYTSKARRTI